MDSEARWIDMNPDDIKPPDPKTLYTVTALVEVETMIAADNEDEAQRIAESGPIREAFDEAIHDAFGHAYVGQQHT